MDAETRAALDTIRSMGVYVHGEGTREEAEEFDSAVAALQRLFDEKGGCASLPGSNAEGATVPKGSGVAAAESSPESPTAPPDSLAKIAADLQALHPSDYVYSTYRESPYTNNDRAVARMIDACGALAARIEALALTPGERERVCRLLDYAKPVLDEMGPSLNGEFAAARKNTVVRWYNILHPLIADLTPIAEARKV